MRSRARGLVRERLGGRQSGRRRRRRAAAPAAVESRAKKERALAEMAATLLREPRTSRARHAHAAGAASRACSDRRNKATARAMPPSPRACRSPRPSPTGIWCPTSMPPIGLRSFPSLAAAARRARARGRRPRRSGRGAAAAAPPSRDVADSDGRSVAERERRRVVPVMRFVSGAARVHRRPTFAATESSYRAAARLCGLVGRRAPTADLYCERRHAVEPQPADGAVGRHAVRQRLDQPFAARPSTSGSSGRARPLLSMTASSSPALLQIARDKIAPRVGRGTGIHVPMAAEAEIQYADALKAHIARRSTRSSGRSPTTRSRRCKRALPGALGDGMPPPIAAMRSSGCRQTRREGVRASELDLQTHIEAVVALKAQGVTAGERRKFMISDAGDYFTICRRSSRRAAGRP